MPKTFSNSVINPKFKVTLTLSWWGPLSYRNQSIDLQSKSMDWFLYDKGLRHERVNGDKQSSEWYLSEHCAEKCNAYIRYGFLIIDFDSKKILCSSTLVFWRKTHQGNILSVQTCCCCKTIKQHRSVFRTFSNIYDVAFLRK